MSPFRSGHTVFRVVALILWSASWSAFAAETPVSIVSSACASIPASRTVNVSTAQSLSVGQSIVLAVAVDSADAVDLVVSGPVGVAWSGLGGHKSEARDRSVLLLRGMSQQNVAAGGGISLNFGLVEAARSVCVRGMRYSSFIGGAYAIGTDGQAQGLAATTPSVAGKMGVNGGMAVAAFIFEANPNALTLSPGAISDGGACNAALSLCLRMTHQGDIVGTAAIDMTPASTSDWQATLVVMATPELFKDSFE
ncbi:MAG TPA: hypothetical protein VN581_09225 [Patescibacteria group bacterium]|nr:hypothetical protein [Patescibacteria group bacterium]